MLFGGSDKNIEGKKFNHLAQKNEEMAEKINELLSEIENKDKLANEWQSVLREVNKKIDSISMENEGYIFF